MQKPLISIVLLLSLFLLGQSCNVGKKITKSPDKMSANELISYLNTHQNKVDWLYGKAKINLDHPDLSMSFSSTIKLENGKNLWANGKKIGFEAGRVLIREDSVFAINRLDKTYLAEGLDYLSKNNLPKGLPAVQQLLLGNPVLPMDESYSVEKTHNGIKISGQYKDVDLVYYYQMPALILDKVIFSQKEEKKKLEITLGEYAMIDDKVNFPYLRDISIQDGNQRYGAEVRFTKVEIDVPQEIKFKIPPHYSKISF